MGPWPAARRRAASGSLSGPAAQGRRYALWKNHRISANAESAKLAWIAKPKPGSTALTAKRACAMCSVKGEEGKQALDRAASPGVVLPYPASAGAGRLHRATPRGHRRRPRPRLIRKDLPIHEHQDPTGTRICVGIRPPEASIALAMPPSAVPTCPARPKQTPRIIEQSP